MNQINRIISFFKEKQNIINKSSLLVNVRSRHVKTSKIMHYDINEFVLNEVAITTGFRKVIKGFDEDYNYQKYKTKYLQLTNNNVQL